MTSSGWEVLHHTVHTLGQDAATEWIHRAADLLGVPRKRSRDFRAGSVTQVQRFSSALNLNPHFHSMIPDGVWRRTATGALEFVAVKPPTTEDVEEIVVLVAERCERWLEQQGFGEHDHNDDPDPDDAQILLQAASAAGMAALGRRAGRRARRIQVHRGRVYQLPQRCAVCDGYNLHAGVRIAPRDREGLERLCRYLARPPVGRERLEEQPDGSILLRLKTAWSDGKRPPRSLVSHQRDRRAVGHILPTTRSVAARRGHDPQPPSLS